METPEREMAVREMAVLAVLVVMLIAGVGAVGAVLSGYAFA